MPDIFNKDIVSRQGPLARSETAALFIGGTRIGLAQNVNLNYGQALQRVYELGSFDIYMVSGRTQGQMQISRVIGLTGAGAGTTTGSTMFDILTNATSDPTQSFFIADGSKGGELTFKDSATNVEFKCTGCYVMDYTVGVTADGSIVNENVTILFQKLEIDSSGSSSP